MTRSGLKTLLASVFFLPGIILFWSISAQAVSPRVLEISAIENEQTHAIAKEVLREAYERLGCQANFILLPAQRALIWANEGKTDGDVARIAGTEKKYLNLMPVPTPVTFFNGVVFTKTVTKPIREWSDLMGLRIGIIRGIRYSAIGTQNMHPFEAKDMTHLFTLLDTGRIEVAVAVREAGLIEIERNFKNKGFHLMTGPPLFSAPLYHYLHLKNKDLIAPLDAVLTKMVVEGDFDLIHKQAFKRLMNSR